jgi:hypothetical protein
VAVFAPLGLHDADRASRARTFLNPIARRIRVKTTH